MPFVFRVHVYERASDGAMGTPIVHNTLLLPHGGWPMAAGPVSRLGSFEPGDKTGLRLSPYVT